MRIAGRRGREQHLGPAGCAADGGGAKRCQDQEERMSIILAAAPQRGVNHTLAASGPSFRSPALLIYSSLLPLYLSHSFTPVALLPALFFSHRKMSNAHTDSYSSLPLLLSFAVLLSPCLGNFTLTHKPNLHTLSLSFFFNPLSRESSAVIVSP